MANKKSPIRTVTIYRDRVGNWRWKITDRNGERTGAATQGFAARRIARNNLYDVTGLWFESPKHRSGNLRRKFRALGGRSADMRAVLPGMF